jgi:hypothetical protein
MANEQIKPIATLLLGLNFSMHVKVLGTGRWTMNIIILIEVVLKVDD